MTVYEKSLSQRLDDAERADRVFKPGDRLDFATTTMLVVSFVIAPVLFLANVRTGYVLAVVATCIGILLVLCLAGQQYWRIWHGRMKRVEAEFETSWRPEIERIVAEKDTVAADRLAASLERDLDAGLSPGRYEAACDENCFDMAVRARAWKLLCARASAEARRVEWMPRPVFAGVGGWD